MPVTRKQLHENDKHEAKAVLMQPHPEPCIICSCAMDNDAPPSCVSGCHHIVCTVCIKEWGKSSNRCPFCRARFAFAYYLEHDILKEIKFKTRNDVNYDYDEESVDQATFTCNICSSSNNIVSMVMCSVRDCPYIAHSACLATQGTQLASEASFLCPTHKNGQANVLPAEVEPVAASTAPAPQIVAPAEPPRDPFAIRVVRKPQFLQAQQPETPYYLGMHCEEDARAGLEELKRRRTEVVTTRQQRIATSAVPLSAPRLSDDQIYDNIYRSSLAAYETRRRVATAAPEFDSFGNIMRQQSTKRKEAEELAYQNAKHEADVAAKAAVRQRHYSEQDAVAARQRKQQFIKQQREAIALEKLRALVASRRKSM
eukprot:GILI01024278.1.p1 GENE.GILI01024278.1~~GILI01024278.1.p1  ORF type:complete len:370 (-),score=41.05 GILI01024278.1:332-1441(-)